MPTGKGHSRSRTLSSLVSSHRPSLELDLDPLLDTEKEVESHTYRQHSPRRWFIAPSLSRSSCQTLVLKVLPLLLLVSCIGVIYSLRPFGSPSGIKRVHLGSKHGPGSANTKHSIPAHGSYQDSPYLPPKPKVYHETDPSRTRKAIVLASFLEQDVSWASEIPAG